MHSQHYPNFQRMTALSQSVSQLANYQLPLPAVQMKIEKIRSDKFCHGSGRCYVAELL